MGTGSPTVSAQPLVTVQVVGGTLFAVAAVELGDATQWNRIAQLNNIIPPDPWLPKGVVTTLQIPAQNPNAGGGVYGTQ